MMDVYKKSNRTRPFEYAVLDSHNASDDDRRVFSDLSTMEDACVGVEEKERIFKR